MERSRRLPCLGCQKKAWGTSIGLSKHLRQSQAMNEELQQPHVPHVQLSICSRSGPHVPIMTVFLSTVAPLFELKICTAGAGFPAASSHSTVTQGSSPKTFWMETECFVQSDGGSRGLEKLASQQKHQPRNEGAPGKRKSRFSS